MEQQQPQRNARPNIKETKSGKKQQYPDTTEQRLEEIEETRQDLYGNPCESKDKKT